MHVVIELLGGGGGRYLVGFLVGMAMARSAMELYLPRDLAPLRRFQSIVVVIIFNAM